MVDSVEKKISEDGRALATLRREIDIGLEAAAANRFSKKTVSDIADEVRQEQTDFL